jgi:hypothetical protein
MAKTPESELPESEIAKRRDGGLLNLLKASPKPQAGIVSGEVQKGKAKGKKTNPGEGVAGPERFLQTPARRGAEPKRPERPRGRHAANPNRYCRLSQSLNLRILSARFRPASAG